MGKPNDDRSDSMNPNNPAHKASRDNRSNQLNPNHEATPILEFSIPTLHNLNMGVPSRTFQFIPFYI
ncbi:MAG: hypothetical protein R6U96_18525 [Promethearchaeia archaeon]